MKLNILHISHFWLRPCLNITIVNIIWNVQWNSSITDSAGTKRTVPYIENSSILRIWYKDFHCIHKSQTILKNPEVILCCSKLAPRENLLYFLWNLGLSNRVLLLAFWGWSQTFYSIHSTTSIPFILIFTFYSLLLSLPSPLKQIKRNSQYVYLFARYLRLLRGCKGWYTGTHH